MITLSVPEGSKFTVGSSGLAWRPVRERDDAARAAEKAFWRQILTSSGARETGIDDLTREGGALRDRSARDGQKIDVAAARLNQDTLSPTNMENLKSSMEHLNEATGAPAESSKKLDGVIDKADSTMESAKNQLIICRMRLRIRGNCCGPRGKGNGLIAEVLNNQALANDLRGTSK